MFKSIIPCRLNAGAVPKDTIYSEYPPTDESVVGIHLECWPDPGTIYITTGIFPNVPADGLSFFLDEHKPICWVPDLNDGDTFVISYNPETWDQRLRRVANAKRR
jgi:hypothetical protein